MIFYIIYLILLINKKFYFKINNYLKIYLMIEMYLKMIIFINLNYKIFL